MSIKKIFIPLMYGANVVGIEAGPEYIKKEVDIEAEELEIIQICEGKVDGRLKNLGTIIKNSEILADKVNDIISKGDFPLVIGGDHSVALGSVSGVANSYKNLGVIWIDAHGDMNTHETTETGNIHGMILASLQGQGDKKLSEIYFKDIKVKTENIIIIGVRDLDKKERDLMESLGVKYYEYEYIVQKGLNFVLLESYKYLRNKTSNVHLSVDLDSIDPVYSPGVSTPVDSGFTVSEVKLIIEFLFDNFNIISSDIVEYNPLKDRQQKTLNILLDIINLIEMKHYRRY